MSYESYRDRDPKPIPIEAQDKPVNPAPAAPEK